MIKKILIIIGILSLAIAITFGYHLLFSTKIGYVEIQKVFNGFDMKKELQQKFEKTNAARKKIIDSLSFDLQLFSQKLKDNSDDKELLYRFDLKRNEFFKKQKEYEEDNAALSNQYDKQILEQLTQYTIDYGKENNYSIIYGTDGSGSVMYADEQYNLTKDVIEYINNKYQGVE